MNFDFLLTQLLEIQAKVEVVLLELENYKKKSQGKDTWDEEWSKRKENGE